MERILCSHLLFYSEELWTESLDPDSKPIAGAKNNPMMPVAWLREYKHESGKVNRVLTTTMGSADDLRDESLRRLVVNGVFWGLKMDVPAKADVTLQSALRAYILRI